jgi:rubrerythrin
MKIAMQRMVEVHTEMMRVMTQDMVNRDSKELPPGMHQVLDNHSRIVQMMSQMMTSTSNILPQKDHGGKEPRGDVEMTLQACKRCGEIGHTSKDCHEQCPYCDTSHPIGECPMTQVTCLLCEGINHVPAECKFYSTVQRLNQ